jgi:membrane protein YdbS with pleckstrin-like domain
MFDPAILFQPVTSPMMRFVLASIQGVLLSFLLLSLFTSFRYQALRILGLRRKILPKATSFPVPDRFQIAPRWYILTIFTSTTEGLLFAVSTLSLLLTFGLPSVIAFRASILCFFCVLFCMFLSRIIRVRGYSFALTEADVRICRGWLETQEILIPYSSIISATCEQDVAERSCNLASVFILHSVGSEVHTEYLFGQSVVGAQNIAAILREAMRGKPSKSPKA